MKKTLFLLAMLVLGTSFAYSQAYFKAPSPDTIASTHLRVRYEMKFMPDSLNRGKFSKRNLVLDIAKNGISSYQEYNSWYRDSLTTSKVKDNQISDIDLNNARRMAGRVYDMYQIVKSYPKSGVIFFLGFAGMDKFSYEEDFPAFNWEVKATEKKEVAGYACTAAIGSYAGRTYKAWFTMDIPVSDGPWKFCGLPGLILEVEDLQGEYFYTCTKIQKRADFIWLTEKENALKTTRERFLKAYQRSKEDPGSIVQSLGNKIDTSKLQTKKKKRAYNPQEKY